MNWSSTLLTTVRPTTLNMSSASPFSHHNSSRLYHNHSSRLPDMDIIEDAGVQALFFVCYTTIFVLGVFGNVLVCYVVGRNRAMQTVTNFFITNLALSDILLCILAVPFTPLYSFLGQWIFGRVLCHLVAYAQGTSVYISTLTLTSIAIDRFFVIIYPFQVRSSSHEIDGFITQSTCIYSIPLDQIRNPCSENHSISIRLVQKCIPARQGF